jgi:hypothetical protein
MILWRTKLGETNQRDPALVHRPVRPLLPPLRREQSLALLLHVDVIRNGSDSDALRMIEQWISRVRGKPKELLEAAEDKP